MLDIIGQGGVQARPIPSANLVQHAKVDFTRQGVVQALRIPIVNHATHVQKGRSSQAVVLRLLGRASIVT